LAWGHTNDPGKTPFTFRLTETGKAEQKDEVGEE
jgi:hypothetical protein